MIPLDNEKKGLEYMVVFGRVHSVTCCACATVFVGPRSPIRAEEHYAKAHPKVATTSKDEGEE